ncbi:MAG: hypothetical protein ACSLEZ_15085 [Thiobacillus sp.]
MSKHKQRYTVVDKHRLAALEHNNVNSKSFEEVIKKGFRIGFIVGMGFAAIVSNLTWVLFRYL